MVVLERRYKMPNNAAMYDPTLLIQAGIDPKTVLPKGATRNLPSPGTMKNELKKVLRIIDEQDAINRFTWYNLPKGLDGRLIERILYYRGQGMFFKLDDTFYFLPYTLQAPESGSGIDCYGRFRCVTPLPFNGTTTDGKSDKPWIQGLTYDPIYDVFTPNDALDKDGELLPIDVLQDKLDKSCVLLKDYTEQLAQTNIPRYKLNDPILDLMGDCLPYMRTALLNSTGIKGMRVGTQNESANVYAANAAMQRAAQEGEPNVPIVGTVDFQELTSGTAAKSEEFLLAMQSLDNFRLSTYGLDNGGLFQKRSHMLEAEQEVNTGNVGLVMRDSLQYRQYAATLCNSIWGTSIWCEPSEVVLGIDTTGDGVIGDNEAGQKEAIQQEVTEDV